MSDTKFKPGQSGNPNGRPKGSKNKRTLALEALLEGEAEGLTRKCIDMAKKGDTTALRLCMERIYPVRKGSPKNIDIPEINNPQDILWLFLLLSNPCRQLIFLPKRAK